MPKRPDDFEEYSVDEIIAEIKSAADGQRPPAVAVPSEAQEDIIDAIAREVRAGAQARRAERPPTPADEAPEPVAFKLRRPAPQPPHPEPRHQAPEPERPSPEPARQPVEPRPPIKAEPPVEQLPQLPAEPDLSSFEIEPDVKTVPPTVPFGRRIAPSPPTPAQEILEEEARRQEKERRAGQAPWRTKRQPPPKAPVPEPQEEDTQEFEIQLEPPGPDDPPPEAEAVVETSQPKKGLPYDFVNQVYADAQVAVRQLDKRIAAMSVRVLLILPLLLVATYMTLCLPRGWPMPFGFTYYSHPYPYLLVLAVLHSVAMVLAAEVTAAGFMRLAHLRPTLDSLVLFGQLAILAHNISIILKPQWGGYLPFTSIGVLGCLLALLAKRQRAETLRRTYKASLMGTVPAAVKQIDEGGLKMAAKGESGAWVDVEAIARPDPTERMGEFVAPVVIAATVALAVAASFGQQAGSRFLWCLAAISAAGAPISLVFSASMPARKISRKLLTSGSGLINAQRTRRLATCEAALLLDGDIFPAGAVEIGGMKIAKNFKMEAVLGCATAMVQEVGGGLARAFSEFARQQYVPPMRAENLRFFESGGMSAQIEGHHVLLGSASFLMRMGVAVSEGVKLPSSLFISIDSGFAGIFSIKYGVQSQAYAAFRMLRAGKLTPVVASRDLNITQAYVESRFELRAGSTEYPDMNDRIRLSEPGHEGSSEALAFLSRDGMLPFAEVLLAAKRERKAIRFGQVMGLGAMVAGLLLMYFLAYQFKVSSATPHNVMLYLLLWLVPSWLGSSITTRM